MVLQFVNTRPINLSEHQPRSWSLSGITNPQPVPPRHPERVDSVRCARRSLSHACCSTRGAGRAGRGGTSRDFRACGAARASRRSPSRPPGLVPAVTTPPQPLREAMVSAGRAAVGAAEPSAPRAPSCGVLCPSYSAGAWPPVNWPRGRQAARRRTASGGRRR